MPDYIEQLKQTISVLTLERDKIDHAIKAITELIESDQSVGAISDIQESITNSSSTRRIGPTGPTAAVRQIFVENPDVELTSSEVVTKFIEMLESGKAFHNSNQKENRLVHAALYGLTGRGVLDKRIAGNGVHYFRKA